MTVPFGDLSGRRQRRLQIEDDPSLQIDPSRVRQSFDFADQTDAIDQAYGVTEAPAQPRQSLGQRILSSLPDAIGYGLAGEAGPYDTGLNGFLGSLGRGYVGTRERRKAEDAQAAATATDRERFAAKMKADLLGKTIEQRKLDLDAQPEWQRQGYPSFDAWREDQRRGLGRSGGANLDGLFATKVDEFGNVKGITRGGATIDLGQIGAPASQQIVPGLTGPNGQPVVIPRARQPGAVQATPIDVAQGTQRKPEAAERKLSQSNKLAVTSIDAALTEMDRNPAAFTRAKRIGRSLPMVGGVVGNVIDETNPDDVTARASIGNLTSLVYTNRYGASQTAGEDQRAKQFLPDLNRDSPAVIRRKLVGFRKYIENEQRLYQESLRVDGGSNNGASSSGTANDDYSDVDLD